MPNLTNGRKLGIGLGIGGTLLAIAGGVLAFVFGKKNDVELIGGADCTTPDVVDADETSVEE